MTVRLLDEIIWDGKALVVTGAIRDGQAICRVPRETIHRLRPYSDAISREIKLERQEIVERLAPFLKAKLLDAAAGETVELYPSDIER
jgi:hypothetical protein